MHPGYRLPTERQVSFILTLNTCLFSRIWNGKASLCVNLDRTFQGPTLRTAVALNASAKQIWTTQEKAKFALLRLLPRSQRRGAVNRIENSRSRQNVFAAGESARRLGLRPLRQEIPVGRFRAPLLTFPQPTTQVSSVRSGERRVDVRCFGTIEK